MMHGPGASAASNETPCTASQLQNTLITDGTSQCIGQWRYQDYGDCALRDPSCGPASDCPAGWNSCTNWAFGAASTMDTQSFSHQFLCTWIGHWNCAPMPNTSDPKVFAGNPTDECNAMAAADISTIQQSLGPGARTDLVAVAPGSLSAPLTRGGGGWLGIAANAYGCTYKIQVPRPATNSGPVCGCSGALDYPVCTVSGDSRCGPSGEWVYSPWSIGRDWIKFTDPKADLQVTPPSNAVPVCTLCDGMTPGTYRDPSGGVSTQKLYQCYQTGAATSAITEGPQIPTLLAQKRQQLYELRGEQLTSAERQDARALYEASPDADVGCGHNDVPPAGATCPADVRTRLRGGVQLCHRLADGPHVSPELASIEVPYCTGVLSQLDALPQQLGAAGDAGCGGPSLRSEMYTAATQLMSKQLNGLTNPDPQRLDALSRQLYLLDQWYAAVTASGADPGQIASDVSALEGLIFARLQGQYSVFAPLQAALQRSNLSPADLDAALGNAEQSARVADQAVISALFQKIDTLTPDGITVNRPPLRGAPFVMVLTDALTGLSRRIDDLAAFHDFACELRDCSANPTNGTLALLTRGLGHLEEGLDPALHAALEAADSSDTTGWVSTLRLIDTHRSLLTDAANAAFGSASLANATTAVTGSLIGPASMLRHARARALTFEATGRFEGSEPRALRAPVDLHEGQQVVDFLRGRDQALDGALTQYRSSVAQALSALVSEIGVHGDSAHVEAERRAKALEVDQASRDLLALAASGDAEEARFSNVFATAASVDGAVDHGTFFQLGNTSNLDLSGADAKFSGSGGAPAALVRPIAAHVVSGLRPGQVLMVRTSGRWSPTCALRALDVLHPTESPAGLPPAAAPIDLSQAQAGPEGFDLQWSEGQYHAGAHSSTDQQSNSLAVGVRSSACAGSPGAVSLLTGFHAEDCLYLDASHTWSQTTAHSTTEGSEDRTTASFAGGLLLPNTPFTGYPAGSLVVVFMDPSDKQILDAQVVREPSTMIPVAAASNAYLVVNDRTCNSPDATRRLHVEVGTLTGTADAITRVVQAMGDELQAVRKQATLLGAQGRVLPAQEVALRDTANLGLQQRLGSIPLGAVPAPLNQVFQTMVDKEVSWLERAVEMQSIEDHQRVLLLELAAIDADLAAKTAQGRLLTLIPGWIIRSGDADLVRGQTFDLMRESRRLLFPLMSLWYPDALIGARSSAQPMLDRLAGADLDASFADLAGQVRSVVDFTVTAYTEAALGTNEQPRTLPMVVVSFPRPQDPSNPFLLPTAGSAWYKADGLRSRMLWDAIAHRTRVSIQLAPEDLYEAGNAPLLCTQTVPVVRRASLVMIRSGRNDTADLNRYARSIPARASSTQPFATAGGLITYDVQGDSIQNAGIGLRYSDAPSVIDTARAAETIQAIGLSPFGALTLDFGILDSFMGGLGIDDATEAALVLELESQAGARLSWVRTCHR